MDINAIFTTIQKGLVVINGLVSTGQSAAPVIKVLGNLITGAKAGVVTEDELVETEAMLDAAITEFNQPID